MIVPGSNLLNMAFGLIGQQAVAWRAFAGMTTNAAGVKVPTWGDPVTIGGSLQPIPKSLIQQLGLDWTKNYVNFYGSFPIGDVVRDKTGDLLSYAGKTYQVLSNNDWFAQDGWKGTMCVEIPPIGGSGAAPSLAFNIAANSQYIGQVV